MNSTDEKYGSFSLIREMLETPGVVRSFDPEAVRQIPPASERLLLTGEGSSRIFPANLARTAALANGYAQTVVSEGALQAREYDLRGHHVFVASNSGKTAEGVKLIQHLQAGGQWKAAGVTGIVGNADSIIGRSSDQRYVLRCGPEEAVAATKSVVEQALVYDTLLRSWNEAPTIDYAALADDIEQILTAPIDPLIVDRLTLAPILYFAGRSNGVAEELALKTNEIIRRSSNFLEGTHAVHGIEEVMQPNEVIILVDPFEDEEEKFHTVLEQGVGLSVIAVSHRRTSFPTVRIPDRGALNPYLQLAAGWNLLAEAGLKMGINIDTPERARKVGNEFIGG